MPAKSRQVRWTEAQHRAIRTGDRSVLVSAAAGSGKTAVLAEHAAYLVCDAPEPLRCNVDELLVVTFTNAAADEMKNRIARALQQRLSEREDSRLARQIMLLGSARISTLHSFCNTVLRRHFNLVGLDPNFTLLDDEEARLRRIETCRQLIAERYETDRSDAFRQLIDLFADGNDEKILALVIRTYEMLCSVVDPQGWLDRAIGRLRDATAVNFSASALGGELRGLIHQRLDALLARCSEFSARMARNRELSEYAEFARGLSGRISSIQKALERGNFDALSEAIQNYSEPPFPRMSNAIPGKKDAQQELNTLRAELKSEELQGLCRFSEKDWRDGIAALLPAAEVFVDLVRQFGEKYRASKLQSRSVDFNDLERLTLHMLMQRGSDGSMTPSGAARQYQRAIKHVLVDEYQDINEVQDAILHLISRESAPPELRAATNLYCVGDVKQSIYRFRLADPTRFLQRDQRLRGAADPRIGTVIDLTQNFRSRAPLLQAVNHVFRRLMTPEAAEILYDETHLLREGAVFPEVKDLPCFSGAPIELHLLPQQVESADADESGEEGVAVELDRAQREAVLVAHRIKELMGERGGERMHVLDRAIDPPIMRPIAYRDIAILLRARQNKARKFADMLRPMGIAVHCDTGGGFFDAIEVSDMRALLSLLDNMQQDIPLAAFLRCPLAGLHAPDDALAQIRLKYPDRPDDPVPFHLAVVRYAQEQTDELSGSLRELLHQLHAWRDLSRRRPLAELIWTIFDQTGYLAFCSGLPDGAQRMANLIRLHERARQFGSFQRQGLRRFLRFLDSLEEEEQAVDQPPVASAADDAVRVMTIHAAKGLEFPVVIVADLGKRHNLSDTQAPILVDRQSGLGMISVDERKQIKYPSAASVVIAERIRRQSLAEEIRVLYVAMTRAREHLILVGTCGQQTLQSWRDRWTRYEGTIPAQHVLSGKSMLDWIGPVAVATEHLAEKPLAITEHGAATVGGWNVQFQGRAHLSRSQQALAQLVPLHPAPSSHAQATDLLRRLTFDYPHAPLTGLAAVRSVGSMRQGATPGDRMRRTAPPDGSTEELHLPRCARGAAAASARERGSAIHVALQHLDFSEASSREAIRAQLAAMVHRKLITVEQLQSLDVEAIWWLLGTDIGRLLRDNCGALRRELSIHFPIRELGESSDPLDQVMVRGRIDVLIPDQEGLVLLDYKTDRVTKDQIAARAELYRPQVQAYSRAIGEIVGDSVKKSYLVFLSAREMVALSP